MTLQKSATKQYWKICDICQGHGKMLRGPSRKRRREYRQELAAFVAAGEYGDAPLEPQMNTDICPSCMGTGLCRSDTTTKADPLRFPRLAIIGAGIGGAALAVACQHRGIPFTLYERDDSFSARAQGYGLTLQQASKAIAGLGINSLPEGITSTRHVVHDPTGKIIGEWGLRKWKKEQLAESTRRKNVHIARQTLRAKLLAQLHNHDSVRWGYELIDFSEDQNGVCDVTFKVGTDTIMETADLVVGADGIRSGVRRQLISDETIPLQYVGCIVMLGICPLQALTATKSTLLDSETVFQTVNGNERMYVMPFDHESVMWQLSYPLEESEAQALNRAGVQAMKSEAMRRLHWHSPIPEIISNTKESDITGYPVYDRTPLLPQLLATAGNATLIGDAAHPMSPFKGQGANQALLDALGLARLIYMMCEFDTSWREKGLRKVLLETFEEEMCARTAPKVEGSRHAAELLHSDAVLHEGDKPRGRGIQPDV